MHVFELKQEHTVWQQYAHLEWIQSEESFRENTSFQLVIIHVIIKWYRAGAVSLLLPELGHGWSLSLARCQS